MAANFSLTCVAYSSVVTLLVGVNFLLQGCSSDGTAALKQNGACESWCSDDKWQHEERHCHSDMRHQCGGCPYCDGGVPAPSPGGNDGDDCCSGCPNHQYCSPVSRQCHDHKGADKSYYHTCGGSGPAPSPGHSSSSCVSDTGDHSKNNGACIVIHDNKVLMIQAGYFHPPNSWDLPGGTNDHHPKEYTCEVAIRETAEEGKVRARPTRSVGGGVFMCTYEGSDNSHHSPEHVNRRWFSLDDYKGLTLRDGWGKGSRNTIINAMR